MFEINPLMKEYFLEIDPRKRMHIFEERLCKEEIEELSFAKKLFERRHTDGKKISPDIDKFLFNTITLLSMKKSARIFKSSNKKTVTKILNEMGGDIAKNETEISIMYYEMRNVIARYLTTCNSPDYRKKLFGLLKSSEDERNYNILEDMWMMSQGLTERLEMGKEIEVWNRAVYDQFSLLYEDASKDFDKFTL